MNTTEYTWYIFRYTKFSIIYKKDANGMVWAISNEKEEERVWEELLNFDVDRFCTKITKQEAFVEML